MSVNPQPHVASWDDEIDLRQLIETLLQRKWLIVGVTAVAVLAAVVFSYFIATPRYESSVVIALPDASESRSLGIDSQAYELFAVSNAVLDRMVQSGNLNLKPQQVKDRLNVRMQANSRLLDVTASAPTAEEALHLAELWKSSFQRTLLSHADAFVGERLHSARDNMEAAKTNALAAVKMLDEFELQNSLTVKEARLRRWEEDLIRVEAEHDELVAHSIPRDQGRVQVLEQLLSSVGSTIDTGNNADLAIMPGTTGPAGVVSTSVTVLNPDFLELSQSLSRTRTTLATNELTAKLLAARLADLPTTIEQLRIELVGLRAEHSRLKDEMATAEQLHQEMLRKYQELIIVYGGMEQLGALTVIAAPMAPSAPVAPRKMLNVALAAVLGGFVGVGIAFFQHFWESEPARHIKAEHSALPSSGAR